MSKEIVSFSNPSTLILEGHLFKDEIVYCFFKRHKNIPVKLFINQLNNHHSNCTNRCIKFVFGKPSTDPRLFTPFLTSDGFLPCDHLIGAEKSFDGNLLVHVGLSMKESYISRSVLIVRPLSEKLGVNELEIFVVRLRKLIFIKSAATEYSALVIVNPFSGNKTALALYRKLIAPMLIAAGINTDVRISEYPRHAALLISEARNLMEQLENSILFIIILGGDGQVHEVIDALIKRPDWATLIAPRIKQKSLVIVPIAAGSSNGLCKSLGIIDPEYTIYCMLKGHVHMQDILAVQLAGSERIVFACLAFNWGFVADIDAFSEAFRHLGCRLKYTFAVAEKIFKMQERRAKVWILDDEANEDVDTIPEDERPDNYQPRSLLRFKRHFTSLPNAHVHRIINIRFAGVSGFLHSWIDSTFHTSTECELQDGRMHLFTICRQYAAEQADQKSVGRRRASVIPTEYEETEDKTTSDQHPSIAFEVAKSMFYISEKDERNPFGRPMARHLITRACMIQLLDLDEQPLEPILNPSLDHRVHSPRRDPCAYFGVDGELIQRQNVYMEVLPKLLLFTVSENYKQTQNERINE